MTKEPRTPGPKVSPETSQEDRLLSWLERHGVTMAELERLPGDVSLRSYFRLRLTGWEGTRIAALYPPAIADAQGRFVAAAGLLAAAGIRVPRIERDDPEAGIMLLEDFGPRTLYDLATSWEECPAELAAALDLLPALRSIPQAAVRALGCPPLDGGLLRAELARTARLVLAPRGLASAEVDAAFDLLCARLGEAPLVPCHRDLMVRNLVPVEGRLGVLDFQDLRLGPAAYDLASLLNDSFFASAPIERSALDRFLAGDQERSGYRRAVVQRSLKAIGTFVAFAERGEPRHLALVGSTLARAEAALDDLSSAEKTPLARTLARLSAAFFDEGLC